MKTSKHQLLIHSQILVLLIPDIMLEEQLD
jgi:hypothetical protein